MCRSQAEVAVVAHTSLQPHATPCHPMPCSLAFPSGLHHGMQYGCVRPASWHRSTRMQSPGGRVVIMMVIAVIITRSVLWSSLLDHSCRPAPRRPLLGHEKNGAMRMGPCAGRPGGPRGPMRARGLGVREHVAGRLILQDDKQWGQEVAHALAVAWEQP